MEIEDLKENSKNLSLVANNLSEDKVTYQIRSSGFDDEEMRHPMHGAIFSKHEDQ